MSGNFVNFAIPRIKPLNHGRLDEWFKSPPWKGGKVVFGLREFESLTFRNSKARSRKSSGFCCIRGVC